MAGSDHAGVPAGEWVRTADDDSFVAEVLERSHTTPVLADFWADWCQPCRLLGPLLEQAAADAAGAFVLVKVDADRSPRSAEQMGVQSLPTVLLFFEGECLGHFVGFQPAASVKAFLQQRLPSAADRLVAQSRREANPTAAQALLEEALRLDPRHYFAMALLADLLHGQGDAKRAGELARQVPEGSDGFALAAVLLAKLQFQDVAATAGSLDDLRAAAAQHPDDLEARMRLGQALAGAGAYEEALEALVQVVERDRAFGAANARPKIVDIFNMLGPTDPLSNRYRQRLSRALF